MAPNKANTINVQPLKHVPLVFTIGGTNHVRCAIKVKCGKNAKPYAPPTSYYTFPSTTDEERYGGCAGDALLVKDEIKIKKQESKSKQKKRQKLANDNLLFESECYKLEETIQTVQQNGEEITQKETNIKSRKIAGRSGTTNIAIAPGSEAFHVVNSLIVQQKYWELHELIVDFVPPSVNWIMETTDWKLLDENLHEEFATRMYDAYMRLFLSLHDMLRSIWDPYQHVPNLEHQYFHELLDHPTHPIELQSRYPCYQTRYGLKYGHFNGNKYVFYACQVIYYFTFFV